MSPDRDEPAGRPEPQLRNSLTTPALRFGERRFDVADLVLGAIADGIWGPFVEETRRGLALERSGHIASARLHAAATAFRYQHRLISAADFRDWLGARDLEVSDLAGVLRRELLRADAPAGEPEPVDDEQVAVVLRAEAICRGVLSGAADRLVERAAALRGLADAPAADPARAGALLEAAAADQVSGLAALNDLERRAEQMAALDDAPARLGERVANPSAVEGRIADHRLNWLRVSGHAAAFDREGAAREACLLVGEGTPLAEVASMGRARAAGWEVHVDGAPPEVVGALVSAVPGDLVGPWADGGRWRVVVVDAKLPPAANDPSTHARASQELLAEAIDRLAAGQVERLVAL